MLTPKQSTIIALVLAIVLGAGVWYGLSIYNDQNSSLGENIVAIVNGKEITQSTFQARLKQAKKADLDVSGRKLKKKVLEKMIDDIILRQKIVEKGVTVSEEELDERIDKIIEKSGGQESFKEKLQEADLTREKLQIRVRGQLLLDKYIESELPKNNYEVTDEEIKNYFKQMISDKIGKEAEPPSIEEMKEPQKKQIRKQIKQEKQDKAAQKLMKELREKSEIKKDL